MVSQGAHRVCGKGVVSLGAHRVCGKPWCTQGVCKPRYTHGVW